MSAQQTHKRWYDRQPRLAQGVRMLFLFPSEVKSIVSEATVLIANREFQDTEELQSFRTLGTDKILGLHKSKNKRREYDQNELLHKAMNYLYILSNENQDFMAEHILKMVQYIQDYLSACKAFQTEPSVEEVAQVTAAYVEGGAPEAEALLAKLREEFYQKMLNRTDTLPPVDFLTDIMQDDLMGMKIRAPGNKSKP